MDLGGPEPWLMTKILAKFKTDILEIFLSWGQHCSKIKLLGDPTMPEIDSIKT